VSTDRTNEIEEIASEWLVRRGSGHWTDADQARFEQWLEASTLNRVAYLRLELAWEEAARLKALAAGVPGDNAPPPGRWNLTPLFDPGRGLSEPHETVNTDPPRRRWTWHLMLTASVVLAIAAGLGAYQFWHSGGDRYATPVGGLASVPMPDGSKIMLNTDSQVRVALTAAERRVELTRGEVFFDVAKDPSRPFVVDAGTKRVVAIGTQFSVRRDGESVQVVVTEGKVRVESVVRALSNRAVAASGSAVPAPAVAPVLLTSGAIARADAAGPLVVHMGDAETHLSWRNGVLMFRDQTLADAVAEFNRYNLRKIVIADPAVAQLKVEGNFRATNVEAFVRLLESGFPIRASADEHQILLRSK
jgi:transmembrane sensor